MKIQNSFFTGMSILFLFLFAVAFSNSKFLGDKFEKLFQNSLEHFDPTKN